MTFTANITNYKGNGVSCRVFDPATGTWYTGSSWSSTESNAQLTALTEVALLNEFENRYIGQLSIPSGNYLVEYLDPTSGVILATEGTTSVDLGPIDSKLDQILVDTSAITTNTSTLLDVNQGNWEIQGTQMIFYRRNGSELMRFDLKDNSGQPSASAVFKREKV